ncbi:MAG: adenylyl-sulfate kinase [Tenuifilaceae bacterium]|jgi:adenylylsulfate kinase|nr:adenylyl-sulfate kinase [Tenuifilaceae bacterium]
MLYPFTIWLTGLPSAGKTTIAFDLQNRFKLDGISAVVVDGDIFRKQFCSDLGFSLGDRHENIRRAASMARIVNDSGVIAICSFISPTQEIRQLAKSIIGSESFVEVFVSTPLSVCKQRDSKGLYRKADLGEIKELTGISSPFETPNNPYYQVDTSTQSRDEVITSIYRALQGKFL